MKKIERLVCAKWVIPVDKQQSILKDHAIAVDNGKIIDILPTKTALKHYQPDCIEERHEHAIMPGFINAHGHAAMTLMRGVADDLSLMEWLEKHIWPIEGTHINEQFIKDGTDLAIAEMISSGTTTFSDMYYFPNIVARCAREAGIRACVGMIIIDFPTVWASDIGEYLSKGIAIHDEYKHDPLIHTVMMPHAPYTVCDENLIKARTYATELNTPLQIHLSETVFEVETSLKTHGKTPVQHLNDLGIIGPDFMGVHMVHLDDQDINILKKRNASVVHCPESNMKLGSGIAPISRLLNRGVNVALGTDGAASNNDLDMLGELRSASLLAKAIEQDATTLDAYTALTMATLNGAKALGLDHVTGSLTKGKWADMMAIDLNTLHTQPTYCPASQIVYSASKENITDVWIQGEIKLKNNILTGFNTHTLIEKAKHWQTIIAKAD